MVKQNVSSVTPKKREIGFLEEIEREQRSVKVERPVTQCRNCKSSQMRFRTKTETWVCWKCGYVWNIETERKLQRIENSILYRRPNLRYYLPLSLDEMKKEIKEEDTIRNEE